MQWFILCLVSIYLSADFCNIYNNNKKVIQRHETWRWKANQYIEKILIYTKSIICYYYYEDHTTLHYVCLLYINLRPQKKAGFKICMKYENNKYFIYLVRNIFLKEKLSKKVKIYYISVLSISYDFISSFYCYFFNFFVVLESLLKWMYFMRSYYCNIFLSRPRHKECRRTNS